MKNSENFTLTIELLNYFVLLQNIFQFKGGSSQCWFIVGCNCKGKKGCCFKTHITATRMELTTQWGCSIVSLMTAFLMVAIECVSTQK